MFFLYGVRLCVSFAILFNIERIGEFFTLAPRTVKESVAVETVSPTTAPKHKSKKSRRKLRPRALFVKASKPRQEEENTNPFASFATEIRPTAAGLFAAFQKAVPAVNYVVNLKYAAGVKTITQVKTFSTAASAGNATRSAADSAAHITSAGTVTAGKYIAGATVLTGFGSAIIFTGRAARGALHTRQIDGYTKIYVEGTADEDRGIPPHKDTKEAYDWLKEHRIPVRSPRGVPLKPAAKKTLRRAISDVLLSTWVPLSVFYGGCRGLYASNFSVTNLFQKAFAAGSYEQS